MKNFSKNLRWCVLIVIAFPFLCLAYILKGCGFFKEVEMDNSNKFQNPDCQKYRGFIDRD